MRVAVALALACTLPLTGCLASGPPASSDRMDPCAERAVESVEYDDLLPRGDLRDAFTARGYRWNDTGSTWLSEVTPPHEVEVALSFWWGEPRPDGTRLNAHALHAEVDGASVHAAAADATVIVNATVPADARTLRAWDAGTFGCD